MFKALLATAAVVVCCLGNDYPAKAQSCYGSSYGNSYSGTCNDGYGGTYQYNGSHGYGTLRGTTGDGRYVDGSMNSGTGFSGTVGGQYVTCDAYGNCY